MITAHGEEMDGYFKVFYPLDCNIKRGEEILLDGDENTTSAFPPGTKVTFSVVQTGQQDDQDQESASDSTSESGNEDFNRDDDDGDDADMASTDEGKYLSMFVRTQEKVAVYSGSIKPFFFSVRTSGNEGSACLDSLFSRFNS